jgi:ATP-dependent DNA helicase RecQ
MTRAETAAAEPLDAVLGDALHKYWGFRTLRPLQAEAIRAGMDQRDSLVVMPTGGGKSLCYQIPPLVAGRTDVVVSPLIALMKDQVDGLRACGYPAVAIHSGMGDQEKVEAMRAMTAGECRLIFVAPERLLMPGFLNLLGRIGVRSFAIDEAHCISHWGHDFRPEYRRLAELKDYFPNASLHAFTATATPRVRDDIVAQLRLREPRVLVGSFDRPNLVYRVLPRQRGTDQIVEVVKRHKNEAAIVYCISRRDTESTAAALQARRIRAAYYHAGMAPDERRRVQDAFAAENLDVVVATVAFGMGIDRSNVRCVVHAAMPKSIEQYQQETGRAGRDGLAAECVLLYSGGDALKWEGLMEKSAAEAAQPVPREVIEAMLDLIAQMQRFSENPTCRHRQICEHFGQAYDKPNCGACDVCLDETDVVPEATTIAMKILSCVARCESRFGVTHIVDVLRGAGTEGVHRCGHDKLSTFGLLKDVPKEVLRDYVFQLVSQGLLTRTRGDMPVLQLNDASWEVMKRKRQAVLIKQKAAPVRKTKVESDSWEGVDDKLFQRLRELRRVLATDRGVPTYTVFGDRSLRDMARLRPTTESGLRMCHGIGAKKAEQFGSLFLKDIADHCASEGASRLEDDPEAAAELAERDAEDAAAPSPGGPLKPVLSPRAAKAAEYFDRGASLDTVCEAMGRTRSTVAAYLAEYIEVRRPDTIDRWVSPEVYGEILAAIEELGTRRLRPIFEKFEERIPYDSIRLVAAHLEALAARE